MKYQNLVLFIVLTAITLIFGFLFDWVLDSSQHYEAFLARDLLADQIEEMINNQQQWKWLSYIFVVLFLLVKMTFISGTLAAGIFLFDYEVQFKKLFGIVLQAEFLFIIPVLIKFVWFLWIQTSYSFIDLQYFYPLSALNIVGYEDLQPWFLYPFQVLNLFEIAYWIVLAYFIGEAIGGTADHGFKIVLTSYVPALVIWVGCIMFVTLNYS